MRRSILLIWLTVSFKSTTCGWNSCLRLKVINCRVSELARLPASPISLTDSAPLAAELFPGYQQAGVAVDDGEEIVKIVRNAAGELADGLHFL